MFHARETRAFAYALASLPALLLFGAPAEVRTERFVAKKTPSGVLGNPFSFCRHSFTLGEKLSESGRVWESTSH
jgi:hypothetical protein